VKTPIYYADTITELDLPDSCATDIFAPASQRLEECGPDHWLKNGPLPESLLQFLEQSDDLLVIVNDHFRPTPTAAILQRLIGSGKLDQARFLVATALHPHPRENLRLVFGDLYDDLRLRISVHDAFDPNELFQFGTKESNVSVNRLIAEVDDILTIGSVEPHYFAGFTGGRKIILPGCASFEDVRLNHAHAVSSAAQPMATIGNPVWEDIQLRTGYLDHKHRYTIQTVTDHDGRLFFVAAGDWDQAYAEACGFAQRSFAHEVTRPYDLVIAVVYPPLDRNLYQLQKSYENVAAAVRDGGSIILVSACREGIGDERFLELAQAEASGRPMISGDSEAAMGIHKVRRTRALTKRLELHLVSELAPQQLEYLPIEAHADLKVTIDSLLDRYGMNSRVAIVLDSATQVLCAAGSGLVDSVKSMEENNHA
jgi:nickel-dependent lactate racemase